MRVTVAGGRGGKLASACKSYLALGPENRVADEGKKVNNKREEEKRCGVGGKKKRNWERNSKLRSFRDTVELSAAGGNKWGGKEVGKEGDETRRGRGGDKESRDHQGNICGTGWIERVNRG